MPAWAGMTAVGLGSDEDMTEVLGPRPLPHTPP